MVDRFLLLLWHLVWRFEHIERSTGHGEWRVLLVRITLGALNHRFINAKHLTLQESSILILPLLFLILLHNHVGGRLRLSQLLLHAIERGNVISLATNNESVNHSLASVLKGH